MTKIFTLLTFIAFFYSCSVKKDQKPVGGKLIVRRNREFEKVLGRDASSDNFLKKQLS